MSDFTMLVVKPKFFLFVLGNGVGAYGWSMGISLCEHFHRQAEIHGIHKKYNVFLRDETNEILENCSFPVTRSKVRHLSKLALICQPKGLVVSTTLEEASRMNTQCWRANEEVPFPRLVMLPEWRWKSTFETVDQRDLQRGSSALGWQSLRSRSRDS